MGQWEHKVSLALQEFARLKASEKQLLELLRVSERGCNFSERFRARERWFLMREQARAKNDEIVGLIEDRMLADRVKRVV
ncbi:hypothetical protein [Allopusillimonas ginsengisoli]|uniref:hypothetical protein n=1 Tax=Allopusillimonas ginsengisoli TaxID=453575 RepID=UPI0010219B1B|nr:hypothetical protein [Allopusillimonas ginsengisoli]TEA78091.1 hypothetical protein ERE07_11865 [Allopusillimonas ginsengisoli]